MRTAFPAREESPTLYKFCTPTSFSFGNLERGILLCRHFADFNDPFEFWSNVLSGVPTAAEPARFAHAVRTWGFTDGTVPTDLEQDAREYFESLEDAQPDFDVLFNHTRISCFSSDPENLLMWSHYADGLRGFCIGFDEGSLMAAGHDRYDYLTQVEYLDAPPTVDSFIYAVADDQFEYHITAIDEVTKLITYAGQKEAWPGERNDYHQAADDAFETMKMIWRRAFAAKPREWEYERESRLLVRTDETDGSPVERAYDSSAVHQIIVGERLEPQYRRRLETALCERYPGASLVEARRSRERYGLILSAMST